MSNVCTTKYDTAGPASRRLLKHSDTLKEMAKRGEIAYYISPSGRWHFDVDGYLEREVQVATQNN